MKSNKKEGKNEKEYRF